MDSRELRGERAKPPRKKYGTPTGNAQVWNYAALEFGVSDEAVKYYHEYTSKNVLVQPQQNLAAVRRRRAEDSASFLTRLDESLRMGCKTPNFDVAWCHNIVVSKFDAVRDRREIWRTGKVRFYEDIIARSRNTTIVSPSIDTKPEWYQKVHRVDDAFKSTTYHQMMSYMIWEGAADFFEELARRGLTTESPIERAYKQDHALMWKLYTCIIQTKWITNRTWNMLKQAIALSDYWKPYAQNLEDTPNRGYPELTAAIACNTKT